MGAYIYYLGQAEQLCDLKLALYMPIGYALGYLHGASLNIPTIEVDGLID